MKIIIVLINVPPINLIKNIKKKKKDLNSAVQPRCEFYLGLVSWPSLEIY